MKSVFDNEIRAELIRRIGSLHENSTAQWGKMTVYQMLKHCTLWEDMISGKIRFRRAFIGYIFGRMALRGILKDDAPLRRSTPTIPELIVKETHGDVEAEKLKWTGMLEAYAHFSDPGFIHPFFGKMTREQIGRLVYKHTDHHLRQFNC